MFRFTIRDVLWLTALVAVALGIALAWRQDNVDWERERAGLQVTKGAKQRLLGKISDLENAAKSQKQERDSMVIALAEELEKALGRKLSGWSSSPDPNHPRKRVLSLSYAESGTPPAPNP